DKKEGGPGGGVPGGRGHEVSILIVTGEGVGRYFGSQPRSKVSMMIMRPPQQGHGRGRMCCSLVAVALGVSESFERDGAASNWRARSMLAARSALANSPWGGAGGGLFWRRAHGN